MAKKCVTSRTIGYTCRTRKVCAGLAIQARRQKFKAVVKAPLAPSKSWGVEITYPLTSAYLDRDDEIHLLVAGARGVYWDFSETGPFCR